MNKNNNSPRISHKEAFELCYLRHQYLRRIKHNPSREEMAPYYKIVENFGRNTFYTYKNLFFMVGLDVEDVVSNAQVQLVSFLGLYALERNPEKLDNFKRNFRSHNSIICNNEDILNKNKANFTCFLKQRMEDMVRVCKQKAKNIKGFSAEEYLVFKGSKEPPKDLEDLIDNYSKYEFKSVNVSVFKTIKKRMKIKQEGPVYLDNNNWYVCVPIKRKHLTLIDFTCNNIDPYENIHNMNPEECYEKFELEKNFELDLNRFNNFSDKQKANLITQFVKTHSKNKKYKKEIETARRVLETLNVRNIR